ncbi:MAG: hypothetical protein ACRDY0_01890 [Acidimicrobiales bacterium]
MADLLDSLRHLWPSGNLVAVTAIDPWNGSSLATDRDEMMADHLAAAVLRHSPCAVVVLAGAGHTRTAPAPGPFGYTPMGWFLSQLLDDQMLEDVVSLRAVTSGGTAWNIVDLQTGGGVHPVPGGDLGLLGHRDVLPVGFVTASPPAHEPDRPSGQFVDV